MARREARADPAAAVRRRVRHRAGSRAALVARMWRTAERQVEEIEDRLAAAGIELAERESNARTLAVVAKTLRELAAVDEARRRGRRRSSRTKSMTIPCPETSTSSVESLRAALTRSSIAELTPEVVSDFLRRAGVDVQRGLGNLRAFSSDAAAGRMDDLAAARRPRRGKDPRRRRMGEALA